jgi:hypothetical protein
MSNNIKPQADAKKGPDTTGMRLACDSYTTGIRPYFCRL